MNDEFKTLQEFDAGNGREGFLHSLPELETQGIGKISRLPISIRIVLESVLRNCDGKKVGGKDVETLARWDAKKPANEEIPFVVARIVLQDFTGVPLVVDLAAMRSAVKRLGGDPKVIEPLVPVDLVVDHSVQVDFFGSAQALRLNLEMEFKRNRERYQFLKWGQQAFKTFQLIPPGIGIVHQVNLEYLAKGVLHQKSEVRNFLSRHTRRDRFAHDHDQWARRGRLGRWRDRSGSGHARTTSLFLNAGSSRCAFKRTIEGRRNRDRSRAAHHAIAARGKSCREVCRILRGRHSLAAGAGPRHNWQHVAGVRRDHGIFPG